MSIDPEFTCDDLADWQDALMCERPELTSEDLAFARLCGALAHRPELTERDRDFAQLIDDLTFTFDFYAQPHWFTGRELVWGLVCSRVEELSGMVLDLMNQPVSEAQGREHRARMYRHGEEGSTAELHVPETWRSPKPRRNAWQRAADKLAQQISMPLDALFAERRKVG